METQLTWESGYETACPAQQVTVDVVSAVEAVVALQVRAAASLRVSVDRECPSRVLTPDSLSSVAAAVQETVGARILSRVCAQVERLRQDPAFARVRYTRPGCAEDESAALQGPRMAACMRLIDDVHRLQPVYAISITSRAFADHGGEIVFLFRNLAVRSSGPCAGAARSLCDEIRVAYDKLPAPAPGSNTHRLRFFNWVELIHAQMSLGPIDGSPWNISDARPLIRAELRKMDLSDVVSLSAEEVAGPREVPRSGCAGYCNACGRFDDIARRYCRRHASAGRNVCGKRLVEVVDWEALSEALVWTSIFSELGCPVVTGNGGCTLDRVFRLLPLLRPYPSLAETGRDQFILMSYFVTHLIFVASGWGAVQLERTDFVEEFIFLHASMPQVMNVLQNTELVGEFVHALRILGDTDASPAVSAGVQFLLHAEGTGRVVVDTDSYKTRYHSAYCALTALAPWTFDDRHADSTFGWHLYKGMPAEWKTFFE